MPNQVVNVKREVIIPCMTCPLCHKLFRDATTISECLHTFCRKCIQKRLSEDDEGGECCPICNIDLGPVPLDKLRSDNNMQELRAKVFPYKRIKVKAPEALTPVSLPAKRKERSLSSLVVSTPRVSTNNGTTGRRSKSTARKASKGSNFTIEKPFRKGGDSTEDNPDSSSSLETLYKYNQNMRQNSAASEPSNNLNTDNGRRNSSDTMEDRADQWKPLDCLVEAANRSKSMKFSTQVSLDNEGRANKVKREYRHKAKFQDDNGNDYNSPESERPKKIRKVRQTKARSFGEYKLPPQVVLDASRVKFENKNYPIWFSLVSSDEQEGDCPPLPQISASYIRIKDGNIPVSFIQKYLKAKLNLASEDEVEINCMGSVINPAFTLNTLVDLWLQTTTTERVSATIGSSAKEFVMVLGYARRAS